MNPKNSFAPAAQPKQKMTFSMALRTPSTESMIKGILGDPHRAAQFMATLVAVVSRTPKLQECKYDTIIAAGLTGVGLGLSLDLGEFAIIPYGDVAQFQLQYKGLGAMAIRTGQYKKIKVKEIRQGEFCGYNEDGDPIIRYELDPDKRDSLPIIGYYAKFLLINGFEESLYMTHSAILRHADRYSKAFDLATYNDIRAGKFPADSKELKKLLNGTPWYDDPDSTGHQKMCRKTVIKQLFGSPFAPKTVEMGKAIAMDDALERGDMVTYDTSAPILPEADPTTGEVIEDVPSTENAAQAVTDDAVSAPASSDVRLPSRKENAAQRVSDANEGDFAQSFFDN